MKVTAPRGAPALAALRAWVEGAGIAGPLVFDLAYAAAIVLRLPGTIIPLAGGGVRIRPEQTLESD